MEALLTLLFNALLLVFVVKLFFALFHMKLVVILLYIAVLLFAMALTGRFPGIMHHDLVVKSQFRWYFA
ncbi:hypothetical protein PVAP13_3KG575501 [Panicum virgatum]|uniref:Uncharacterized protein n=1 Tax=Panicum virgatum TaxID=38727 RepID=A0A8T0V368_PANVG|nr:hypothetical protein PVAP13_3KG575501 [Panicum virgatum]